MRNFLTGAALILLAACASAAPQNTSQRYDWACDRGAAFSLRYNASGAAEVFAGGQVYTLPAAPSGSGTRYSNGAVEYREHQGEASLDGAVGGPYTHCRR